MGFVGFCLGVMGVFDLKWSDSSGAGSTHVDQVLSLLSLGRL
jgi:hypothetical protein